MSDFPFPIVRLWKWGGADGGGMGRLVSVDGVATSKEEAEKLAKEKHGCWKATSGPSDYYDLGGGYYALAKEVISNNGPSYEDIKHARREKALAKLTEEDKAILGLED